MDIVLQKNVSEKNALDKTLTDVVTMTGTLKNDTSLIDPVITFEADLEDLSDVNYMTIDAFSRSYFVTGIKSIKNGLVEISGHVDVLSSHKDQIRALSAIIRKQAGQWNLYLNDGSLRTYQDQIISTRPFPSGFSTQSFILAVAGS